MTERTQPHPPAPAQEALDIREFGAPKDGAPQTSERRLYMQLHVYTGCLSASDLVRPLESVPFESVLYLDVNDPQGIGLLVMAEDPDLFAGEARKLLSGGLFGALKPRPELTMMGRTYSSGRETDLEDWLLWKPRRNALNAAWPWAVWYPLRRKPEFETLERAEQGKILGEHARIGMTYGQADLAHDIRLACHGLDQNDNEFVIGLVGKELYPLSRIVQDMRKTQQTSRYIQSLGPFFVGRSFWQSPFKGKS